MQQICSEGIQEQVWLDEKGDPLGIVQEIRIKPYWQMVNAQARICPRKMRHIKFSETLR